jgi:hypothetical protein
VKRWNDPERLEQVQRDDLLRQFRDFFGVDVDGLVREAWRNGFEAGALAEEKRRQYIEDTLSKLREVRGF